MSRPILSIKLKIVVTFAVAFIVMVGLLATTGYLMILLETRVVLFEQVSRLEEKVQDLRRDEKNLFLYQDRNFGRRTLSSIEEIRSILESNGEDFDRVFSRAKMLTFSTQLLEYERAMSEYLDADAERVEVKASKSQAELTIRNIGTHLLTYAESIAQQKRTNIWKTIHTVNRLQLAQALFVGVGLLLFGGLILGKVVHPLKVLQDHAYRIGQGDFSEIDSPSQEHEIDEVYKAFNRMARDLQKREMDLDHARAGNLGSRVTLPEGIANDLNGSLSRLRSNCQSLCQDTGTPDEEAKRKSCIAIAEEVDKLGAIVRGLLERGNERETVRKS